MKKILLSLAILSTTGIASINYAYGATARLAGLGGGWECTSNCSLQGVATEVNTHVSATSGQVDEVDVTCEDQGFCSSVDSEGVITIDIGDQITPPPIVPIPNKNSALQPDQKRYEQAP